MRKAIGIGLVLLAAVSVAEARLFEDFESYVDDMGMADQTKFNAAWPMLFKDNGTTLAQPTLVLDGGAGGSAVSVHGVAPANNTLCSYRLFDSFTDYVGTDERPMIYEFDFLCAQPDNVGSRQFVELRGVAEDGFPAPGPPFPAGTAPVYGTLQTLFAMGTYNTPNAVAGNQYYYRIIAPGVSGWFEGTIARTEGWHKLRMEITSSKITCYVDGVKDIEKFPTGPAAPLDYVLLSSRLTSNGHDCAVDNLLVEVVPEPVSIVLLGLGCLLLRRRR